MTDTITVEEAAALRAEIARISAHQELERQRDEFRERGPQTPEPAGAAGRRLARQRWRQELRRRAVERINADYERELDRIEPKLSKLRDQAQEIHGRVRDEQARHQAALAKFADESTKVKAQQDRLVPVREEPGWFRDDALLTQAIADEFNMPPCPERD
jgi:hypothetical protein